MRKLLFVIALLGWIVGTASAADVYITQAASGGDTGADCANAHSATWFNTAANWSNAFPGSVGKVNGGDTVHLCGTISGTQNTSTLVPPGYGVVGNPVTILWESGAVVSNPSVPAGKGVINCSYYTGCRGYLIFDGGTNGVIEQTDNGSPSDANIPGWPGYTYQRDGHGLVIIGYNGSATTNVEVKNLTIRNVYRMSGYSIYSQDVAAANGSDILFEEGSNLRVHHNNLLDSVQGITISPDNNLHTMDDVEIDHNYISNHKFGLWIGAQHDNDNLTNVRVHDNEITGWQDYKCPCKNGGVGTCVCQKWDGSAWVCQTTDMYHHDGIFIPGQPNNTNPLVVYIYNNYLHGDLTPQSTAFIFGTWNGSWSGSCVGGTTVPTQIYAFNNVFVSTAANSSQAESAGTFSPCPGNAPVTGPHFYYNNTFVGYGTTGEALLDVEGIAGSVAKNNIFVNGQFYEKYAYSGTVSFDYNVFYGGGATPYSGPTASYNLTNWRVTLSQDVNSIVGDPKLGVIYRLLSTTSAAYSAGINLTSLCAGNLTPLCADKPPNSVGPNAPATTGKTRPATGPWDAGAYIAGPAKPTPTSP